VRSITNDAARDGQTNTEIGAQLFLGARTVEWHLGNVFTELGIASRRELRQALAHHGQADRKRIDRRAGGQRKSARRAGHSR